MWKRTHKKLRSRSGETLAEVLVALLIIALSSMLLVAMYNTAASIDLQTRDRDKAFYEDWTSAETRTLKDGQTTAETGTVTITGVTADPITIPVTVYGGNGLSSYEVGGGG